MSIFLQNWSEDAGKEDLNAGKIRDGLIRKMVPEKRAGERLARTQARVEDNRIYHAKRRYAIFYHNLKR